MIVLGSLATMAGDADVGTYDEDGGDESQTDDEVEEVDAEWAAVAGRLPRAATPSYSNSYLGPG